MTKQYTNAAACLAKIIAINPKEANAYVNRGNCYYSLQEYAQAYQDWQKAIELDSRYSTQLQSFMAEAKSKMAAGK